MTVTTRSATARALAAARSAIVVAVVAVASVVAGGATGRSTTEAASDRVVAIVVEGTGYGHGRGMSQWGAYGYAVDHGWGWQRILDHYYGGTTTSSTSSGQRIAVRLTRYDGLGSVGVVSHGSGVRWGSRTAPAMRATEVERGVFDVYRADRVACPESTSVVVPDGPIVEAAGYVAAVEDVQRFLKTFHGPARSIVVDGYFGRQTRGHLESWQEDRRLPVDGTRWDADDAAEARAVVARSESATTWTKIGTHTQRVGVPLRFTSADGDAAGTDAGDVLGVCAADGTIGHVRGAVEVVDTGSGNRVVNDVLVEAYLRGVVPREISASWAAAGGGAGADAVRAQAVAARSYGLAQSRSYTYDGSAVRYATTCDTMSCQVYGGAATRGTVGSPIVRVERDATDAAIAATANVVRTWPAGSSRAGSIVSTEFSASNGPRTAGGAFPPVDDVGDDTAPNPNHRWTRIIDADDFARDHGLGTITSATTAPTTDRSYEGFDGTWYDDVVVTGTAGTFRQQAWDFRRARDLRSPGFTVRAVRASESARTLGFIGDSVGSGVTARGAELDVLTDRAYAQRTFDAVASRCSARSSCPGTSGVEAARSLPRGLDLVVVELGYNDDPASFADDVDAVMAALVERDARRVAWVNLADIRRDGPRSFYAPANAALAAAAERWPTLTVLDWDEASDTSERVRWFARDGVHLTTTGEAEFALWLRDELDALAPSLYLAPPQRVELPVVGEDLVAPDGSRLVVPAGVTGVALNVTMVRPAGRGYGTVWPCGAQRPVVSSTNFDAGEIVANNVIAPVSDVGSVCLFSSVGTHLVVDVMGWFEGDADTGAPDPFTGVTPQRRVDTRSGLGGRTGPVTPSSPLRVPVAGLAAETPAGASVTVPDDVAAVAVNVAVARADGRGFATVWPCGTTMPVASNVNFEAGAAVSNAVVAPVGDDGSICVHVSRPADVIVDLAGFLDGSGAEASGPAFSGATPTRVVDTRLGVGSSVGERGPSTPLRIPVRGLELADADGSTTSPVPSDASAVALNLTVVGARARGYATVWPCGTERPLASNLNYVAGRHRANSVVAPIGAEGSVCVFVDQRAHVVVDVAGWFRGGDAAAFRGAVPRRLVDTRAGLGPEPS
ncbi:SpoIID/LytB domain-containing protein [Ilumatobacter sp.]|uniref:SpoIID/LytB domain-containing protein n=1 Tax=Ilumatobacter sp. TaxID=1967498 RepID=UPI003B52A399